LNGELHHLSEDQSAAFYTICDARFFLGLVALVNSLRLQGHKEPIYVVDCGLEDYQRELISQEVTLVSAPDASSPHLLKYVGPQLQPAHVAVVIDADIIVTRSLQPLVDKAAAGKVVVFTDRLADRFSERWVELLGLDGIRSQPYVNSGFIAVAQNPGAQLLEWLRDGQRVIDTRLGMVGKGSADYPFYFLDQDVLNAILGAKVELEQLAIMDHALAPHPPFAGLTLRDPATLDCVYADGVKPFFLHHVLRQKPWLTAVHESIYSRLLPRLWLAADVAIRLGPEHVPLRFRDGALASIAKRRHDAFVRLRGLRGRVGLVRHLHERRRRRAWSTNAT
jgi:hypothetical protein